VGCCWPTGAVAPQLRKLLCCRTCVRWFASNWPTGTYWYCPPSPSLSSAGALPAGAMPLPWWCRSVARPCVLCPVLQLRPPPCFQRETRHTLHLLLGLHHSCVPPRHTLHYCCCCCRHPARARSAAPYEASPAPAHSGICQTVSTVPWPHRTCHSVMDGAVTAPGSASCTHYSPCLGGATSTTMAAAIACISAEVNCPASNSACEHSTTHHGWRAPLGRQWQQPAWPSTCR
jgi:hypothetical protein